MSISRVKVMKIYLITILCIINIALAADRWVTSGPYGATILDFTLSPPGTEDIFVATNTGGLYKSNDMGQTWKLFSDTDTGQLNYSKFMNGVAYDLQDSNKIYFWGRGGLLLGNIKTASVTPVFSTIFGKGHAFLQNPQNPDMLLLGFDQGISYGLFDGNPGFYISTDKGESWEQHNKYLSNYNINDLKFITKDYDSIFATTDSGVFIYNISEDYWMDVSGNIKDELCITVAIDSLNTDVIYVGTSDGLYKTNIGGFVWQDITGDKFKSRFINYRGLHLFGQDQDKLLVGTKDGLYYSPDAGITWYMKNDGLDGKNVISIHSDSSRIFIGTGDGFYSGDFSLNTWTKRVDGMMALDHIRIDFDSKKSTNSIYSVSHAGVHFSVNKGATWEHLPVNFKTSNFRTINIFKSDPNIIYLSFINGVDSLGLVTGLLKTYDGGTSWEELPTIVHGILPLSMAVSSNNPDNVYFGTTNNGLYKSVDGGYSWKKLTNGLPGDSDDVLCIRIDPNNENTIYVGILTQRSSTPHGVFKSIDGGESWKHIYDNFRPGEVISFSDIAINSQNTNTIYAATNVGLLKSINGGGQWFHTDPAKFVGVDNRLYSVCLDQADTNIVYCAGYRVYKSDEGGKYLQELHQGLPAFYGTIREIRIDPLNHNLIYAATNGSGIWVYDMDETGIKNLSNENTPDAFKLFQNYPNPFNNSTRISYTLNKDANVQLNIFNVLGKEIETIVDEHKCLGNHSVNWSARDLPSGTYFAQLTTEKSSHYIKIVLEK